MMIKKQYIFSFSFFVFALFFKVDSLLCQKNKNLKAYMDMKQFYSEKDKNYIEIQFQFIGHTAKFIPTEQGFMAQLLMNYEVYQDDSLITKDSYVLESPASTDSIQDNFYDLKRFQLKPGSYNLVVDIKDINNYKSIIHTNQIVDIEDLEKKISMSDILIAEVAKNSNEVTNFVKSGYYIVPYISTYFPTDLSYIPYYVEIYNTTLSSDSSLNFIQKIINSITGSEISEYTKVDKIISNKTNHVFNTIDISNLSSGSYILELSIADENNNLINSSTYDFERSNNLTDNSNAEFVVLDPAFQTSIKKDSVDYYLASLIPISNPAESKNIIQTLKNKNEESSRKLIQSFWVLTASKNNLNAYDEWMKYKAQVNYVEKLYRTNFQDGHETDRGRVYLKYGAPSSIVNKEVSPSEYPYEIWTYNKIGIYSNKRFLFYNPDLVNNAYRLLHSDMLGERKTPGWAQVLSKRNTNQGDIDNPNKFLSPSVGNNSQDLFRQY